MTYAEIKCKQKKIAELRSKVECLRAEAESTTQKLSQVPAGGGVSDKVGAAAVRIAHYESLIKDIQYDIQTALSSLPDTLEGHCVQLKIQKHYSWVKIAHVVGKNYSAEALRKRVFRLKW